MSAQSPTPRELWRSLRSEEVLMFAGAFLTLLASPVTGTLMMMVSFLVWGDNGTFVKVLPNSLRRSRQP